jgi:hypothetical protein
MKKRRSLPFRKMSDCAPADILLLSYNERPFVRSSTARGLSLNERFLRKFSAARPADSLFPRRTLSEILVENSKRSASRFLNSVEILRPIHCVRRLEICTQKFFETHKTPVYRLTTQPVSVRTSVGLPALQSVSFSG